MTNFAHKLSFSNTLILFAQDMYLEISFAKLSPTVEPYDSVVFCFEDVDEME